MRTIVFIDGQNLYHLAKTAWIATTAAVPNPYGWPSYDVGKLARALVCRDASFPKSAFTPVSPTPPPDPTKRVGMASG